MLFSFNLNMYSSLDESWILFFNCLFKSIYLLIQKNVIELLINEFK